MMELTLPVDHPLAVAIIAGDVTKRNIVLSLDSYEFGTWDQQRIELRMELERYTWHGRHAEGDDVVPEHVVCQFRDPRERQAELERLIAP